MLTKACKSQQTHLDGLIGSTVTPEVTVDPLRRGNEPSKGSAVMPPHTLSMPQ